MTSLSIDCIPEAITRSIIFSNGGVLMMADLAGAQAVDELDGEAFSVRCDGKRNEWSVFDGTEGRGGNPRRAFTTAHASHVQWRIFSAPALVASVAQSCGLGVAPTGGGTYTYYERPGDFLALHLDVLTCDLTVITCLRDTGKDEGALVVYPQHSLTRAREAGRCAGRPVAVRRGESAVLLGGFIPHEVTPMGPEQERIVSVMCYRVAL